MGYITSERMFVVGLRCFWYGQYFARTKNKKFKYFKVSYIIVERRWCEMGIRKEKFGLEEVM